MRGHPKGDSVGQPSIDLRTSVSSMNSASVFVTTISQYNEFRCIPHCSFCRQTQPMILMVIDNSRNGDWYSHFWKPLGEPWRFLFLRLFFLLFSYRQPFFQRVCAQEVTMFQNSSNKKAQYPKPYQSVRDNLVHYSKSLSYISLLCVFGQFSVFRSSCLISLVHSFISLF